MLTGKENFPLDCSERDMLHMTTNKCPQLGKVNQKRRIAGRMETCLYVYLSSLPSEVRKKFEQGKEQTWGFDETNWLLHLFLKDLQVPQ